LYQFKKKQISKHICKAQNVNGKPAESETLGWAGTNIT